MNTKSVRRLDGQGRVILPSHIRKALNLSKDSEVTINLRPDGAVIIRPAVERCCICADDVTDKPHISVASGDGVKVICDRCKNLIKEADGCTQSFQKAMVSGL